MDPGPHLEIQQRVSPAGTLAFAILVLCGLHCALVYFDLPVLSPGEALWNALVYCIPTPLLLGPARRQELRPNGTVAQTHAAKADALRKMLGLGGNSIFKKLPAAGEAIGMGGVLRRMSAIGTRPSIPTSDAPAGLGNWDNSCYQNSVIQALASLSSLKEWLGASRFGKPDDAVSTNGNLQQTITNLLDATNNGRHLWTPARLKNMSSWQQQDAQEYFAKILDELDKEAAKAFAAQESKPGLESLLYDDLRHEERSVEDETFELPAPTTSLPKSSIRNPLEGLVAQRVVCTSCGFSEGQSMIPFNCLTVPLGSGISYDLADCLDEYTKREAIDGVECRRCTLLQAEKKLSDLLPKATVGSQTAATDAGVALLALPSEVRAQAAQRLQAIQDALERDDFSDKTLKQACQIPAKAYVNSTKVREACIGRAPESLVIHINRSMFDEMTGALYKNHAQVRYPLLLDLQPWVLGSNNSSIKYHLRAAITHYGRHENGHYICYRQHYVPRSAHDCATDPWKEEQRWWRLSDEDVSPVTEPDVLGLNGAFMLFYERDHGSHDDVASSLQEVAEAAAMPLPAESSDEVMIDQSVDVDDEIPSDLLVDRHDRPNPLAAASTDISTSQSTTSESTNDGEAPLEGETGEYTNSFQQPPVMRTAGLSNVRHEIGLTRSVMTV